MSTVPTIGQAIVAVKKEVGAVRKGDKNSQQGFSFRGVDAVVNAVSGALITHGVTVYPVASRAEHGSVEVGAKRTPMGHVSVTVTYRWLGPAGDWIDSEVPGEAMDSGDKAAAKAMSVAYRTALLQTLTLPTDERDPDADVHEIAAPRQEITAEDNLNASRTKLWTEAQEHGWTDAAAFATAFGAWSNGVAIAVADRELLTRCMAALRTGTFTTAASSTPVSEVIEGTVVA